MADLGTDIGCVTDIGKVFAIVSGRRNLAMAIARRLYTPRGGLFYDPDYGYSLVALLSGEFTRAGILAIGPDIVAEALKDERVLTCTVDLSYDDAARKLTVELFLTDADGPFPLILSATALTVELLKVG